MATSCEVQSKSIFDVLEQLIRFPSDGKHWSCVGCFDSIREYPWRSSVLLYLFQNLHQLIGFGGVNKSLQKKELSQTLRLNKEKQVFQTFESRLGKKDIQTENGNIHVIFKTIDGSNKILFNHT